MSRNDVKDSVPPESAATATPEPDAAAVPASTENQIEQLQLKLEQAEAAALASQDRFLRERAELENFRKRMQREKADALRFACEPLVRDLLPIVDNLERAVEHGAGNGHSVLEGIRMVLKALLDVLERHGVRRIDAVGEVFDPNRHEAIAQVESAEHGPNRVVQQHQSGYMLQDRLLRPALVTVSRRKSDGAVETGPNRD